MELSKWQHKQFNLNIFQQLLWLIILFNGIYHVNCVVKLTYVANGFYLALFERSIFSESVQAWKYGTMIPSVYGAFGDYGHKSIKEPFLFAEIVTHKTVIEVLDKTCDEFKRLTDLQLAAYCQEPSWSCSYSLSNDIPNELIMEFFKSKLKKINNHL